MRINEPSQQPGATPFDGWSVDESGKVLKVWWDATTIYGVLRVFTAEEADAVYILALDGAKLTPEEEPPWHGASYREHRVVLQAPLGRRTVIDASTGQTRTPASRPTQRGL